MVLGDADLEELQETPRPGTGDDQELLVSLGHPNELSQSRTQLASLR